MSGLFEELPEQQRNRTVVFGRPAMPLGAVRGHSAVMAGRVEAPDSLDFFPTPPWVGRCLVHEILPQLVGGLRDGTTCWEPAVGAGHLAYGLASAGWSVFGSDIADYGAAARLAAAGAPLAGPEWQADFCWERTRLLLDGERPDWIVTNPPFNLSRVFVERALERARVGVAMVTRLAWLESAERWQLRQRFPLWAAVSFAERVAMVRGAYDSAAPSATAYAVLVWYRQAPCVAWGPPFTSSVRPMEALWTVPPGAARRHMRVEDRTWFEGAFKAVSVPEVPA